MAFTYTPGSTTDLNRVRLALGDTDSARALFTDDELSDFLVQETSINGACAAACEALSVRFARDYTFSADGASFNKDTISQKYAQLAVRFRAKATGTQTVVPQRKDGYSDDIGSDEATIGMLGDDFDRGRFSTSNGRLE